LIPAGQVRAIMQFSAPHDTRARQVNRLLLRRKVVRGTVTLRSGTLRIPPAARGRYCGHMSSPDAIASSEHLSVQERVVGGVRWVAIRARGADWSWLTPKEAAELAREWKDRYDTA
jgi:hypothetical protein